MPSIDAFMKTGDLLPELTALLQDADGNPIDFSAASAVAFTLRPVGSATPTLNNAATWVDSSIGSVKYTWAGSDSSITAGDYHGEFRCTFVGGKEETFPNNGHLFIRFVDGLA